MGYLGDFPTPVWYHPRGIANIMSMDDVATQFRMMLDSQTSNALCLHSLDGKPIAFTPSTKGLYKHVLTSVTDITTFWSNLQHVDNTSGHAFIETVSDRADKYTHWDINLAHAARCLQNITMRPASHELMDKIIASLPNCPITKADILRADDVWGPNLGSLKGKTVQ